MEYVQETLDRTTGQLVKTSLGEWISVTELGKRYRVGPKRIRAILYHMGVLAPERGRYRLPRHLVERGFGKRHDRPRSGHPFDVLSPLLQKSIEEMWQWTFADYEAEQRGDGNVVVAKAALEAFRSKRQCAMTTQEEVCWILDHCPNLAQQQVAEVLEVDRTLVSRYAKRRASDRGYLLRQKKEALPGRRP